MNEEIIERAHGRVNLIGEHTDYNGGWVLPTAIPQFTEVILTKRHDRKVLLSSSKHREFSYYLSEEKQTCTWADYLMGATYLLREYPLEGFAVHIDSTMPEGSGLSSSAALEISLLKALRRAFNLPLKDEELARIGQRIENEFVGARVGIMDQMACALARGGEALFLDTLTLEYEKVKLPLEHMDLIIINSGISHKLSGKGGYNERRAQCEEACKILGISSLRELNIDDLKAIQLPELLMKRVRHVVTENDRVFKTVKALKAHDLKEVGRLFLKSHVSMRDDYEVSIPEIDLLVDLCMKRDEFFGARLTGGGFGGSIVAIAEKGKGHSHLKEILSDYFKATKTEGKCLL